MIFQQFFHRFYDPHRVITMLGYLIQIASQKNQQFLRIIIIIVFIGLFVLIDILLDIFRSCSRQMSEVIDIIQGIQDTVYQTFR